LPSAPILCLPSSVLRPSPPPPSRLRLGYAKNVTLKNVRVTAAQGDALLLEDTVEGLKRVE